MTFVRSALLLALLLGSSGCPRDREETPESVLTAWVQAMNASRSDIFARQRAFELLSAGSRASLTERAQRASQLSGREMQPWEMLAPGRFAMRFAFDPDGLSTDVHGDRATVTARARTGEHAAVPMVREGGHWRVDLALPTVQSIQIASDGGT